MTIETLMNTQRRDVLLAGGLYQRFPWGHLPPMSSINHREPAQSVCVADCYFKVNVLDLPFPSPIAIYR